MLNFAVIQIIVCMSSWEQACKSQLYSELTGDPNSVPQFDVMTNMFLKEDPNE